MTRKAERETEMKLLHEITIGERLKRLRERVHMSQADISGSTGIAVSLISRYERNEHVPGWGQIEKMLDACNSTPCDLFEDYCVELNADNKQSTFAVPYWDRRPDTPANGEPTSVLRLRKNSDLAELLGIATVDDKYALIRAVTDAMIPDVYPGDLMVSDRQGKVASGKIIAGYLNGEPAMGRLTRHAHKMYLVPSNRRYAPVEFSDDQWDHRGVIIYSVRDLTMRFFGGKEFIDETSDIFTFGGGAR
jgi:SOS-response transcriptional repressor LexA